MAFSSSFSPALLSVPAALPPSSRKTYDEIGRMLDDPDRVLRLLTYQTGTPSDITILTIKSSMKFSFKYKKNISKISHHVLSKSVIPVLATFIVILGHNSLCFTLDKLESLLPYEVVPQAPILPTWMP